MGQVYLSWVTVNTVILYGRRCSVAQKWASHEELYCLKPCVACAQKVTGADLKYSVIIGKPSEITFRFAEHMLAKVALKMHLPSPTTLYMIGYVRLSFMLVYSFF